MFLSVQSYHMQNVTALYRREISGKHAYPLTFNIPDVDD